MMPILEVLIPTLGVAAVILFLLLPGGASKRMPKSIPLNESLDDLRATHYQHFPLIRQALSAADETFLRQRVAPEIARTALRERRAVARKFLSGLHEDFTKLDHLARIIAALSPNLDRHQEAERLKLSIRFRVAYALVWVVLRTGNIPLPQFEQLAGLIGQFADRMEQSMASINALSSEPVSLGSRP